MAQAPPAKDPLQWAPAVGCLPELREGEGKKEVSKISAQGRVKPTLDTCDIVD